MGAQLRAVRQRIRGVQSIAKITRAQELIAASRIIKAQQRVRDAGPYAREITQAVEAVVSRSAQIDHPLVREPQTPAAGRGADSHQRPGLRRRLQRQRAARGAERLRALLAERGVEPVTYVVGPQGHHLAPVPRPGDRRGSGAGSPRCPEHDNAREIAATLLDAFGRPADEGGVDEIHLVYTEFVSMLTQNAVVHRILPLEIEETTSRAAERAGAAVRVRALARRTCWMRCCRGTWRAGSTTRCSRRAASEIAARRRAMKSATDNANDLLEQFTLRGQQGTAGRDHPGNQRDRRRRQRAGRERRRERVSHHDRNRREPRRRRRGSDRCGHRPRRAGHRPRRRRGVPRRGDARHLQRAACGRDAGRRDAGR